MKKAWAVILCVLLTVSLFACSKQVKVDYENTAFDDWMYRPAAEEETAALLVEIDACEYGTLGASLKQMHATVSLFRLCSAADGKEALTAYLREMTDTQRDFFSFQWQMRVKHAAEVMENPLLFTGLLRDSGLEETALDGCSMEDVTAFDTVVKELLESHGVKDEWKNHLQETPFIHWELGS